MPARGLFETHLTVADVARSVAFYRDVVGLDVALELPERGAAFLWIGRPGQAMLGLWSIGSAPVNLQLHVAFTLTLDEVLAAPDALRTAGVQPLSFFAEPSGEPSVIGWMPAAAVYFRDPDGHLLEYLAMLDGPARAELGVLPWSAWTQQKPATFAIRPHTGPRAELRPLFALAEDSASRLDAYLDEGRVLVAVDDGQVAGHLQLTATSDEDGLEVKNMAVLATHQRRGIGRALVTAAVRLARDEGRGRLRVATAAADVGNLRFYQRVGFRMQRVERDAFTPATGYAAGIDIDGIPLRDRVWLDLAIDQTAPASSAASS